MACPFATDFVFRVSTDPIFGYGHVSRLLALRRHLTGRVKWFADPGGRRLLETRIPNIDVVEEESCVSSVDQLVAFSSQSNVKILICDSYQISCDALQPLSIRLKILFFCDRPDINCPPEFIMLNPQPKACAKPNSLTGPRFLPLDTQSSHQTPIDFASLAAPVNCLIGFGYVDSKNFTSMALSALLSDNMLRERIRPICLLGPQFKYVETIKKLLRSFPTSKILYDCQSVLNVPIQCPLAIGAPGLSHAERLYCGMATVLVPQNATHETLCNDWEGEGCALSAKPDPEHIALRFKELIANEFEKAQQISSHGQSIVDGKGASRIAANILAS